jgi:hypothetical protein
MKTCGEVNAYIHAFLTSALVRGDLTFNPSEKEPPVPTK